MTKCKDCNGRGHWQERETIGSLVTVEDKFCDTCAGLGTVVEEADQDDFDLAGVGVTEGDDDE